MVTTMPCERAIRERAWRITIVRTAATTSRQEIVHRHPRTRRYFRVNAELGGASTLPQSFAEIAASS